MVQLANATTQGHPIIRMLLFAAAQVMLPLAEQALAAWLASKGIVLPQGVPANDPPTAPAPAPTVSAGPVQTP